MATCQKKIQTGTAVVECGRPAAYLCVLPATYTVRGRLAERTEYRCLEHREGEWVRARGGMTSNPKPEREKCPHDGHLLDRAGKCWYCGGIYPAGKPALTVVEAEPKVEGESVQTMTVDLETGEVQEPAGQMVLGDDPAFVRVPMRKSVPVTKVSFSGTVAIADWELEAYLSDTGQELAPGRVVRLGVTAYMPGPYAAWVKRSEKDEGTRERREWWEHEGRIGLKVVDLGSMEVTAEEWSDD